MPEICCNLKPPIWHVINWLLLYWLPRLGLAQQSLLHAMWNTWRLWKFLRYCEILCLRRFQNALQNMPAIIYDICNSIVTKFDKTFNQQADHTITPVIIHTRFQRSNFPVTVRISNYQSTRLLKTVNRNSFPSREWCLRFCGTSSLLYKVLLMNTTPLQ